MNNILYIFLSVIIVSLLAVVTFIPFMINKKFPKQILLILLSFSVGTLLGTVFFHFIPKTAEHGFRLETGLFILTGFIVFFIIERFIHWHHSDKCSNEAEKTAHSHGYHLALVNLIGDGIHNFLDGLVIAGAYLVNIPLGVAATISIAFHEIPQEIADFGVLLYSGMSKRKAVLFNLFSALMALVGATIGIILFGKIEGFNHFIISFAAGTFLYIASANLVPELHRHCKTIDTILHILSMVAGIAFMVVISLVGSH